MSPTWISTSRIGREQEEAGELDLHLQDGQRDVAVEQQVLVADPAMVISR